MTISVSMDEQEYEDFRKFQRASSIGDMLDDVDDSGYHIKISHDDSVLTMHLLFDDEVLYTSHSKIYGSAEHDIIQAVSYDAHMIYKFSEQTVLGGREDA